MENKTQHSSSTLDLFVSVGTRFTMNRLLCAVEEVCKKGLNLKAAAQTGNSNFKSKYIQTQQWVGSKAFEDAVRNCDVFVSHAGVGNILLAAKFDKPIVIMPRLSVHNEHINDHQSDTANAFKDRNFVRIAHTSEELEHHIKGLMNVGLHTNNQCGTQSTQSELILALKHFIDHGKL